MNPLRLFCALALLAVAESAIGADGFAVTRFHFSSGGGVSTNIIKSTRLTGKIGQASTSSLKGGTFSLRGGVLGGVIVIQTPEAPTLVATRNGDNINFTWTVNSDAWVIESSPAISGQSTHWTIVDATLQISGNTRTLTLPLPSGIRFFRLHQP